MALRQAAAFMVFCDVCRAAGAQDRQLERLVREARECGIMSE